MTHQASLLRIPEPTMKRTLIRVSGLPLLLALGLLGLSACGRNSQPGNAPVQSHAVSSSIASVDIAAPSAAATAPVTNAQVAATAEQVTETDSGEPADAPTIAQPLALRIAEVKPEPASQWKEGVNYQRLVPTQPTTAAPGQVEVTEVFWYECPHCYALEPVIEGWLKNGKPNYVSFVRVPVMWGPVHHTQARMFYTAELLGKLDELHPLIFAEIHQRHNELRTAESISAFFTSHGVAAADFQKSFSSFAVESSLKRAESLNLRYKIESVPTFIINGKYVTDVGKAGGQTQLLSLINELASRERGT
jgi:protein dithiol oxidoreductase (disulfide-forming)